MSQYSTIWRNKWLTSDAKTIEDMITSLRSAAEELECMSKAGILLYPDSAIEDDFAILVTPDAKIAKEFGLEEDEEDDEAEDPD